MLKSTAALLIVIALAAPCSLAARAGGAGRTFVTDTFNVTPADWVRIQAGRVVTRTLHATNSREVATLGVVRMKITPEYYVSQIEDIATFKKSDQVLQVGRFSSPPVRSDVAAMTVEDADIRALRSCRPGDCDIRLPAAAIERIRREIDWRRPDARERAHQLLREILVDYVAAYTKTGVAASMRYADTGTHLDTAREAREVAAIDEGGWKRFPELGRHVLDYQGTPAPGISDLIYWSKEKVASRQVVSVTHLAIAHGRRARPPTTPSRRSRSTARTTSTPRSD